VTLIKYLDAEPKENEAMGELKKPLPWSNHDKYLGHQ